MTTQHTIYCPHTTDGMCQNCVNLWTGLIRDSFAHQNDAICQTLGNALGFPWYKDDQANFPGATEENGVCVGDHVAESLAEMAAKEIEKLNKWKREAMSVMAEWDEVWVALGKPGQIGDKIPAACKKEVERRENRIAELLENFKPLTQQYAAAFRAVGILIEREQYEEASLWKDRYEDTMREIDSILKGTK